MKINEVVIDNDRGWGAVPYNGDVATGSRHSMGFPVLMKPSTFLRLAAPLGNDPKPEIVAHIKKGGTIGAPFLDIRIPSEWEEGDLSKPAMIAGHEGRNRVTSVLAAEGDKPFEMHLFMRDGLKRRDITPEMLKRMNEQLVVEKSTRVLTGPFFEVMY